MAEGPRACRPEELDAVVALLNSVFREGSDQDIRTDYPLVFEGTRTENIRIVVEDGKVVSEVPVAPREVVARGDRFGLGIISPTVTHPEYRRRGYATLCLRDTIRLMQEVECDLSVLWTAPETFPFYQNSGWEAVASQGWMIRLRRADGPRFDEGAFEVMKYDPATGRRLAEVMRIHDADPYRISRSERDYRVLFALPKTATYLAMKGEQVAAYLTLAKACNKRGVIESGGEPEAVERLVRHVLLQGESDEDVFVGIPLMGCAVGDVLESKGFGDKEPVEELPGVGYQMMRVNRLEGFIRNIQGYLSRKARGLEGEVSIVCKDSDEYVTLRLTGAGVEFPGERSANCAVLSRRELAQLFFGSHEAAEPIECPGQAGEILNALFPFHFVIPEFDHC